MTAPGRLSTPGTRAVGDLRVPRRLGGAGLMLTTASVLGTLAVGVLGPSVMEPALPGRPGQPPWASPVHPPAALAVALAAAALAAGTGGLGLCLFAAHRGWTAAPRALLGAGIAAAGVIALVPPFGSADQLNYAAFGRMVITGHDPYTTTAAMLARLGDPVARAVQDWRGAPSVYGSAASGLQALASAAGGTSVRLTVFAGSALTAAAFAMAGLLLHRMTRGNRAAQFRAALLWTANPVLLQVLVAGAHLDSEAAGCVLAGLAVGGLALRSARSWRLASGGAAAGALLALGAAVKLSMALVPAGMIIALLAVAALRRSGWPGARRPVLAAAGLGGGFVLATALALLPWGPGSLRPALRDGGLVSVGSPWRATRSALRLLGGLPEGAADGVVRASAVVLGLLLLAMLLRALVLGPASAVLDPPPGPAGSGQAGSGQAGSGQAGSGQLAELAAAGAAAAALAWLFAWPYVLPWYDALGWALLALVPAAGSAGAVATGGAVARAVPVAVWRGRNVPLVPALDWLLLARTAALGFGYLPARGLRLPPSLAWLETVVRTGVTPVVLLTAAVALAGLLWPRRARPSVPSVQAVR